MTAEEQQIVTASTIETETEEVNYEQEEQIYANQGTELHHEEGQLIIQDEDNNDVKNIGFKRFTNAFNKKKFYV